MITRAIHHGHTSDGWLRALTALVAGAWVVSQTMPWVFSADVGTLRSNLSFLRHWSDGPPLDAWNALRHAGAWVAVACACRLVAPSARLAAAGFVFTGGVSLLLQMLMDARTPLSFEELIGMGISAAFVLPLMLLRRAEPAAGSMGRRPLQWCPAERGRLRAAPRSVCRRHGDALSVGGRRSVSADRSARSTTRCCSAGSAWPRWSRRVGPMPPGIGVLAVGGPGWPSSRCSCSRSSRLGFPGAGPMSRRRCSPCWQCLGRTRASNMRIVRVLRDRAPLATFVRQRVREGRTGSAPGRRPALRIKRSSTGDARSRRALVGELRYDLPSRGRGSSTARGAAARSLAGRRYPREARMTYPISQISMVLRESGRIRMPTPA